MLENLKDTLEEKFKQLKKYVGVVDKKEPISFELSEFMQETENALQKLPSNYRELFEIKAVEHHNLFVGRQKEFERLSSSFADWQKERFVTCALIGEKGGGSTSLLNYFLHTIEDVEIIRHELHQKIYTENSYITFVNTLLGAKDITSNKELIDFVNNSEQRRIVVLENLQHMFLKRVDGFVSMKMLFELMSYTTKKILWIGTFTPASWNYLDKTISASNYFTSEITLEPLPYEVIKEIILRHEGFGQYEVEYLANEQTQQSKSYKKLSDEKKQEHLQEQLFKLIHKLSNGNISLAKLYWMRAIDGIEENHLRVGEISDLDYSFIKNLSEDYLFTLQTLLLHDGLILQDFSIAVNEPQYTCRNILMPMLEKGLLIQPNKKYNINPVIYKHIYDYLASKNFIH